MLAFFPHLVPLFSRKQTSLTYTTHTHTHLLANRLCVHSFTVAHHLTVTIHFVLFFSRYQLTRFTDFACVLHHPTLPCPTPCPCLAPLGELVDGVAASLTAGAHTQSKWDVYNRLQRYYYRLCSQHFITILFILLLLLFLVVQFTVVFYFALFALENEMGNSCFCCCFALKMVCCWC